ncbi:Hypothetical predicted protein [Olea europaea subsp. europaea]|uniref:Uncharacterized protein n=1 Tax=Olea europaea subsp. europaea TaxID=158383 RepID=A0A8S0PU76_OLEEU|nr:Hypothetical predicted protein [Olea europaea subsp. europaea]
MSFYGIAQANMSDDKNTNTSRDASRKVDLKFLMEALIREMRTLLRAKMEQVHERIDQVENALVGQPQNHPIV